MRQTQKLSFNELPAAIISMVFIALLGGIGLIIVSELSTDSTVTSEACDITGVGTYTYNTSSGLCWNGSASAALSRTDSAYGFLADSQTGLSNVGSKLGLIGTILILSVIIGLVVTYFAIRNM